MKEVISQKQAVVLISAFIIGSSAVLGVGSTARQDVWLAMIIAMAAAGVMIAVYARVLKLFPGNGLYDILDLLFGKVMGRVLSLLFIWYAFHLGAMVRRNFSEFVRIVSLPETPTCIIGFIASILTIWAVRGGIELLGRWISFFFPIMVFAIVFITLLSVPLMDFTNLKPVLYHGMSPVLSGAFDVFSFPFAETVLFMAILNNLRENASPYRTYFTGLLIGGGILALITVRSILILGDVNTSLQNFASYASVRLINIGDFLQRIEASVSLVFIFSGFIKSTVCLYAVTEGTAYLFNIQDYHRITAPLGLLTTVFSITLYDGALEMFEWVEIYKYYAVPFQILLPLIIWITAEIKCRIAGNQSKAIAGNSQNADE